MDLTFLALAALIWLALAGFAVGCARLGELK